MGGEACWGLLGVGTSAVSLIAHLCADRLVLTSKVIFVQVEMKEVVEDPW